jgi:DNA-binding LacI/PurR family transcriptional regulator
LDRAALNRIGKAVVTQAMVATAANVHKATVSLALRNDARLPELTRRKVQAVARKLGYLPHPLVSVLMSRVRRRNLRYRGTIAYLRTLPRNTPILNETIHRNFLLGAQLRARELGYGLEQFHLDGAGMSGARVASVLRARNIAGLVIEHTPSPYCPDRQLPFSAEPFATVTLCTPLAAPKLHYVANDQYMRAILAARELLALGYRRLGLVVTDRFDIAMAHRLSAGFWAVQHYVPELKAIPILHVRTDRPRDAVDPWLRRYRPDAVLGTGYRILDLLRAAGARVPEDLGWAHLDWLPQFAPSAGVCGNSERTGAAAVELVVSQIHRGESGSPAHTTSHFVSGTWISGSTVRVMGPPINLEASFFAGLEPR